MTHGGLVRPSRLARFWELHPSTVVTWIRQGRLAAVRSPGNRFMVRVADVRAFCERERMNVPPFLVEAPRRVLVAGARETQTRAVVRALKPDGIAVDALDDPYEAVLAAATGATEVLAIAAGVANIDAEAAIRALKRTPATAGVRIVVFSASGRAEAAALERAGADRALVRARMADLPRVLREILGLPLHQ